jgi:hypothetical protein
MFVCSILSSDASCSTAILQSVNIIPKLIGTSHRALYTTISQEPSKKNILDSILPKKEIEIGGCESTKTTLTLANDIVLGRFHEVAEIRSPFSCFEEFSLLDP